MGVLLQQHFHQILFLDTFKSANSPDESWLLSLNLLFHLVFSFKHQNPIFFPNKFSQKFVDGTYFNLLNNLLYTLAEQGKTSTRPTIFFRKEQKRISFSST